MDSFEWLLAKVISAIFGLFLAFGAYVAGFSSADATARSKGYLSVATLAILFFAVTLLFESRFDSSVALVIAVLWMCYGGYLHGRERYERSQSQITSLEVEEARLEAKLERIEELDILSVCDDEFQEKFRRYVDSERELIETEMKELEIRIDEASESEPS